MPTLHLLRHRSGIPTQLQLYPLWRSLHFVLRTRIESIFLADPRHTLRSFSPVFLRRITIIPVPIFIEFRKPGKLFSNKRQKLLCRRRHKKQHAGPKPQCPGLSGRFSDCFQVPFAVG